MPGTVEPVPGISFSGMYQPVGSSQTRDYVSKTRCPASCCTIGKPLKPLIITALYVLVAIAILPLVVLGLYVIADRLGLRRLSNGLLDLCGALLSAQWLTGGIVNLLGGLAICGLGLWALNHLWHEAVSGAGVSVIDALGPVLVPFGLWRVWRGVSVLAAMRKTRPTED